MFTVYFHDALVHTVFILGRPNFYNEYAPENLRKVYSYWRTVYKQRKHSCLMWFVYKKLLF